MSSRSPTSTTTTDDSALHLAEDAWAYTPLWPGQVREERDEYVLWHGTSPARRGSVTRIRLSDVEHGVADARAWFHECGHEDFEVAFGVFAGDEIVASASVIFTPLGGFLAFGGTHPDWRGRGAYRALVRARWDEAARRGVPLLATHARPTSRPILERLGFRTVSHVHVLLDHAN